MKLYDFELKTIDGKTQSMEDYRGRVLLIVNVASQCGFTPQYAGLEELHRKYHERGFEVLGFPCNQFAGQEPGSEEEIKSFCEKEYQVTFPLFSKIDVNGPNAHPLYEYLKEQEPGLLGTKAIKWNFTKFLIDAEGSVRRRIAPKVNPLFLTQDIEELLNS